jgi:hypothetical protein
MGQEGFLKHFTFEKIPNFSKIFPFDGRKLVIIYNITVHDCGAP